VKPGSVGGSKRHPAQERRWLTCSIPGIPVPSRYSLCLRSSNGRFFGSAVVVDIADNQLLVFELRGSVQPNQEQAQDDEGKATFDFGIVSLDTNHHNRDNNMQ